MEREKLQRRMTMVSIRMYVGIFFPFPFFRLFWESFLLIFVGWERGTLRAGPGRNEDL